MNINYQIKKLKNNIKIIYNSNTHNITTLSVFVKVGSKDETANDKGLSHFLEHMLFKGTIKRSNTKIISSELDEVGAYFNAYTDKNLTCFIIKLNSDYVNKAINILSDILLNSTFLSKNVEKEINVVIEELNKDKDNNIRVLIENIYKLLFHNNSLSYPTGGYNQDITKFNTNNVKVFWKKYYNSNNMVISVSSNLSFNNIFNKIKNSEFNNFQIGVENKCKSQNLKIGNKPKYNIISKNLEQVHLAIGFKVCNMFNKDKYVLLLIKIILAGNMSSRLFTQLRENNGLSYNIDIDLSHYETTGGFIIYTSLDKNSLIIKNINKPVSVKYMNNNDFNMLEKGAIPIILDELKKLKKKTIKKKELNKAIGYLTGNLILNLEDSSNLNNYFGRELLFNNKITDYKTFIENIQKITYNEIKDISNKYFTKKNINVSIIGDYKINAIKNFIDKYNF